VVTVIDDDAPVLTAPAALTVGTNTGGTYVGAIGAATATDNVSIGGGITITDNRPAAFPLGNTTVTFTAVDEAGNTTTATQVVTVVDDDAPVVTYTGNAGTYTVDQTVNIICSATDAGSGIASTTCANITGPAHTFAVGVNTRTATATDNAGNAASATVSFTVTVPPSAVGNVITQFFDSPAEAAKANHTLNQATSAPNANARAAHLNKLKKDIEKEIGKTLTAAEAATLISLLNNLY
ncbi:MAG TPA: hypothetical protein VNT81_10780, partial [Vicinamibacterales bacterium]|nr:hypothetical protein [Vicinamibacterales bacterium]